MEEECKHKVVFGYDMNLIVMCEKCKKELPSTQENLEKARMNG